jgi:hypothetical protein
MQQEEEMGKMSNKRIRAHCSQCRDERIFGAPAINHRLQIILSILTMGLWLPVYGAITINATLRPWRCLTCGWHKPEFRNPCASSMRENAKLSPRPKD